MAAVGHPGFEELIPFPYRDGVDPVRPGAGIGFERRLLDYSLAGAEDDEVVVDIITVINCLYIDECPDAVIRLNIDHVLNRPPLTVARTLGQVIDLLPVALAVTGKEEHGVMHCCNIHMLNESFFPGSASPLASTSPVRAAELGQRRPLDVTHMRNGNNHLIISVEILRIEFACGGNNLSPPFVSEFVLYLEKLILDNLHLELLVCKNLVQVFDEFFNLLVFSMQLILFQPGELPQAHLHDCSRLNISQPESLHQPLTRDVSILRRPDNSYDLIDI